MVSLVDRFLSLASLSTAIASAGSETEAVAIGKRLQQSMATIGKDYRLARAELTDSFSAIWRAKHLGAEKDDLGFLRDASVDTTVES